MKQRSTTPAQRSFTTRACVVAVIIMALAIAPVTSMRQANAENFDAQISALEQQMDEYDRQANELGKKKDSYNNRLGVLNNQKSQIESQLKLSTTKANKLRKEIAENEQKIEDNQTVLGDTIADMYVDNNISPLEMLASSDGIADFIDKQTNRESIQESVQTTIEEINVLKKQLEKQKKDVDVQISNQKFAREQLAEKQAEVSKLKSQVEGQERNYRKLSAEAKQQKDAVQQQQQATIEAALQRAGGGGSAVAGDPNKGGYPGNLANSDYYNPVVDPWGMYSRQCVSYTAWKVYQKNGSMPYWGGHGNANQWPGNARAAGIPVNSTPRAGSVGVLMAGQYGHTVWVESVNSNGTINISQYNYYNAGGSGWGHYSEMNNVSPAAYDYYIHF